MDEPGGFESELAELTEEVQTNLAGMLEVLGGGQSRPNAATTGQGVAGTDKRKPRTTRTVPQKLSGGDLKSPNRRSTLESVAQQPVLVNVTTRLTHSTNELLTETALRQRLRRVSPATRQEIVEEALLSWFRHQGYLKDP